MKDLDLFQELLVRIHHNHYVSLLVFFSYLMVKLVLPSFNSRDDNLKVLVIQDVWLVL